MSCFSDGDKIFVLKVALLASSAAIVFAFWMILNLGDQNALLKAKVQTLETFVNKGDSDGAASK